jgi:phospholipid/cholesterol/gamma-HCH transport system substrate-binding protein
VAIYTYLDDSYAITPGSPVRLNGILIGEIRRVRLSGEDVPTRVIRVEMEVDREMLQHIPTDSVAAVASENVLGSKYINIKRGQGKTPVEIGGEIVSLDTRGFEEVVASGYETLTSLQSILKRIDAVVAEVEVGRGSVGKLLTDDELYNHLTGTVAEAHKVTAALNKGEGTIGRLLYDDTLYEELRSSMARIDRIIEDVENGQGTIGMFLKDPSIFEQVRDTVAELKQVVADLNAGKGTAGRLLKDEELHQEIASVVSRLDTTLEKLNTGSQRG